MANHDERVRSSLERVARRSAAMLQVIDAQKREAQRLLGDARDAVAAARKELDNIEEQLDLAALGCPFRRVGRVDGVDAGAVFGAFQAIEALARFRKLAGDEGGDE